MNKTVIVIMTKNNKTGFLEKEIDSFSLPKYENLIINIFGEIKEDDTLIHMKVSTENDVLDWQYNAIFDSYDHGIYFGLISSIKEDMQHYNPTWEIIFIAPDHGVLLEEKILKILDIHFNELQSVFEVIKDMEEEYSE